MTDPHIAAPATTRRALLSLIYIFLEGHFPFIRVDDSRALEK